MMARHFFGRRDAQRDRGASRRDASAGGRGARPDGGRGGRAKHRGARRCGEARRRPIATAHGDGVLHLRRQQDRRRMGGPAEAPRDGAHGDLAAGAHRRGRLRRPRRLGGATVLGPARCAPHFRRRGQGPAAQRRDRRPARRRRREGAPHRVPGHRRPRRDAGAQAAGHAEGRRRAVRLPRPGLFPRDPHRDRNQGARRRAHHRDRPGRVRAGRGSLVPVLRRSGRDGEAAQLPPDHPARRAERGGGRRALPLPHRAGRPRRAGGSRARAEAGRRRAAAVAARNEDGRTTIYVGAASGGVWKSGDGGTTFRPVFDKAPVQSIGAIAIDPTHPQTVWVGTGESWTRNSVSIGDGIYKSTDGGETWTNMGLRSAERIVRILVHPKNGNVVYACVPGKLWSDSPDRGLYKTTDGGRTWDLILTGHNYSTGCSGLSMDAKDPDVLFAGLWDFRRKGWTFRSGGDGPDAPSGSGLYRSADGGATWTELAAGGLPPKPWGRVEVAVAPSNANVVYAFVESKDSGLYRSADGGKTWEARDKSQMMVWRPFYFARLVVDPTNADRVFKPDLNLIVSEDGGRSFAQSGGRAHGDWHDVWVDPDNPKHVVGGDDGGLWISYDGGSRWWKAANLPVSQFYHVSVDDKDPYQVYGGLQDNSSWVGDSAYPGGISNSRWENVYNGDGFWTRSE